MNFRTFMKDRIVVLDGAMGTMLQSAGLREPPETYVLSNPEVVAAIHRAYFEAGSNVVCADTFGANPLRYPDFDTLIQAAIRLAKEAVQGREDRFVALDIGPLGRLLEPFGDLGFEEAVAVFAQVVRCGAEAGADLVMIETMNDSYETKAALLAAKENCDLPVLVSNAYGEDGKLLTGATPQAMVAMLEGMGVDAIGANCSFGPAQLAGVVDELLAASSVPVLLKPNAGLPTPQGYDVDQEEFVRLVCAACQKGVRLVGGCCGTTPAYIAGLAEALPPCKPLVCKEHTVVSSYTHALYFDRPVLIGERLNPTGKKRLQAALADKDWDYVCDEALRQQEAGADALDVNVAVPLLDEAATMDGVLSALMSVVDLPLQIDSASPAVLEKALRRYNGKALVNSVSGKESIMHAVFPSVARYGGVVVALTLDENGIPATAEERVAIAQKIVRTAASYGIGVKDLLFDPLCLTVSADSRAATVTLDTIAALHALGYKTVVGLSNISYGLPVRDAVNGTFLAMALSRGLSAAIVNPFSSTVRNTYYAYMALAGLDKGCVQYVAHVTPDAAPAPTVDMDLRSAVIGGFKERASQLAKQQVVTRAPLDVINNDIIPALDEIGRRYEEKRAFLPQLLLCAEAAKSAFEAVKVEGDAPTKCTFVLATVHGDIHDIGKNIVGLMLSNYGFRVVDLGKDVAPQAVVDAVLRYQAPLVGLSSLMTTTLPAMENTVRLLKEQTTAKVMVGGAVLTPQFAEAMGADCYAKDAMETVRYAERVYAQLSRK